MSPETAELPPDLDAAIDAAWQQIRAAPGFLTEREGRFLALLAAATPARGTIVEIGSFKGKSTVGLATIAARYGTGPVVAMDPHTAPSATDPDLEGQASSWEDFTASLRRAGVAEVVEAHRAFSRDVAAGWSRPIRLLWIDGDHTYAGAREDLDLYLPHVVPGGIVALHDVLHDFDGPIRVFVHDMLASNAFGPAGVCGSIGWAQYRPEDGDRFASERRRLARRAARLIPLSSGAPQGTLAKLRYKLWRARVPHGTVLPAEWALRVAMPPEAAP